MSSIIRDFIDNLHEDLFPRVSSHEAEDNLVDPDDIVVAEDELLAPGRYSRNSPAQDRGRVPSSVLPTVLSHPPTLPSPKFQCKLCDRSYGSKYHLKRHVKSHNDIIYNCDECSYSVTNEETFKGHNKANHPELALAKSLALKSRTFPCEECEKVFGKNSHLTRHALTHKDIMYKCDKSQCNNYEVSDRETFQRHMKAKHSGIASQKFICNKCNKTLLTKRILATHNRVLHSGPQKLYNCPLCTHTFKAKHNMERHMKKFH